MKHQIYKVISCDVLEPYTLKVKFNDGSEQLIELSGILKGEVYGPLSDFSVFKLVKIDPEIHTLVWPNGADFDPAILHDWPKYKDSLFARALAWH